jgi:hypothetical protein
MGRPALENREGRGVRQLEIHHNERRLGITRETLCSDQVGACAGLHIPLAGPLARITKQPEQQNKGRPEKEADRRGTAPTTQRCHEAANAAAGRGGGGGASSET